MQATSEIAFRTWAISCDFVCGSVQVCVLITRCCTCGMCTLRSQLVNSKHRARRLCRRLHQSKSSHARRCAVVAAHWVTPRHADVGDTECRSDIHLDGPARKVRGVVRPPHTCTPTAVCAVSSTTPTRGHAVASGAATSQRCRVGSAERESMSDV